MEHDTMPLIVSKAKRTAWQTKKLAAKLKGSSLAQTLRNDSDFILKYIRYVKDSPDHEQIRSPRRLIHDAKGDCDCYAVTLATLLINQGIKFRFRITQYASAPGQWAHIYIVVPKDQRFTGSLSKRSDYVVVDPVTNLHDHEVNFLRKRDYTMSLQYLDGIAGARYGGFSGFGECPPKTTAVAPTPGQAPSTEVVIGDRTAPVKFLAKSTLTATERKSTVEVLEAAGIPYQYNLDEKNNPMVMVGTPQGAVMLPTSLDSDTAASLITSLSNQSAAAVATQPQEGKPSGAGVAMTVIGLGGIALLLKWAFSGSGRGQLGGPEFTRKKLPVLHI